MKIACIVAALCLAACSSATTTETYVCGLGTLRGAWRALYIELDGTCGPQPSETVLMDPDANPAADGCRVRASEVSDGRCRMDVDIECSRSDGGTERLVQSVRQTGVGSIAGSFTLQIDVPGRGSCRSTYSLSMTRL